MLFKEALLVVFPLVYALPWDGPAPTPTAGLGSIELLREQYGVPPVAGWSPKPTTKPRELFEGNHFLKRQSALPSTSGLSLNTCGFLNGATAQSYTCDSGYTCGIATSQHVYACCETLSNCNIQTTCIPQSQVSSCAINSACAGDTYATKCDSYYPFCNQIILLGEGNEAATDWYCDTVPFIGTIFATATDGGKSSASFAFVTLNIVSETFTSSSSSPSSSSILSSPSSPSSSDLSSSTSKISSTLTTIVTTSSATGSGPTPKPSTPIGAIVGGSIGGVAVIAAMAVGIFLLLRRGKKDNKPPPMIVHQVEHIPDTKPGAGGGATSHGPPEQAEKIVYQTQTSPISPQHPQDPRFPQGLTYSHPPPQGAYIPYSPSGGHPQTGPAPQYHQQRPTQYTAGPGFY